MGRVQADVAGKPGQPLQRAVLQPGEATGPLRAQQVGPAGRGHQEAAAGEQGDRLSVDQDQVAGVLGGVPRGVDRAQGQPAGLDVLQVEGGRVRICRRGGGRQHQLGAGTQRGLLATGEVVVVQVGLQHEPQLDVTLGRGRQEPVDVALRVHQDALALVNQ